jgi:ribosomal protein S7
MLNMLDDKKDKAALIVSVAMPQGEQDKPKEPLEYACEAIMQAIDKRDKQTLRKALESFCKMVYMSCEQEEDEDEEEHYDSSEVKKDW